MAQAAVPDYLGSDFADCPPGHRYTLYGPFWEPRSGWSRVTNVDAGALSHDFAKIAQCAVEQGVALRTRQKALVMNLSSSVEAVFARSVAPFATGTGIEHPLENGMAFLNPYGLPYLPGASVKGVLRRAAQELACDRNADCWGTETAWTLEAIEHLFGKEPAPGEDDASRGALTFWDVIPDCTRLGVDIMNPHHGSYYRGESSPHDSENPIPIYFLTVPEGSGFAFFVQCDDRRLGDARLDWRSLLREAFAHAFAWLGFGAKTAVGYGAMEEDERARTAFLNGLRDLKEKARLAAMTQEERRIESLLATLANERAAGTLAPSSRVASERVELLREALDWDSDMLRRQAAQAIQETVRALPWSKKAKAERQADMDRLRQPRVLPD